MNNKNAFYYVRLFLMLTVFLLMVLMSLSHADGWAIKTIAYEASNQSFKSQVAVGSVIKTRSFKRKLSPKEVVFQPSQFSCWKNKKPTQKRKLTKKEISVAKRAWNKSKIGKFNHYAHYTIKNYWTKKALSKKRIGDHIFYKL